jgi:hypothetical protein
MTADQPTRRDLLRALTQEAADHGAYGEHEGLRQQLADALYQWTLKAAAGGRPLIPQHEANVRENSAARAEVCAAVVQPVLDAKDAEIARMTNRLEIAQQTIEIRDLKEQQ